MSEKIQALRMVLMEDYDWSEEEILDYHKMIDLIDNNDYLVLNENEVHDKCIEYLEDYIDSCGYIFSNIDLSDYANEQFFEDYYKDYFEQYIDDLKYDDTLEEELKHWKYDNEDELLEKLIDDVRKYGYINDFIFNYGNEYFTKFVKEFPECIDKNELFEDIIRYDGAGNILSSYDGIEHEVKIGDNFYYVYRID